MPPLDLNLVVFDSRHFDTKSLLSGDPSSDAICLSPENRGL